MVTKKTAFATGLVAGLVGSLVPMYISDRPSSEEDSMPVFISESPNTYLEQFDYSGEKLPENLDLTLQRIEKMLGTSYSAHLLPEKKFSDSEWGIVGTDYNGDSIFDKVSSFGDVPGHLRFLNTTEDFTDMVNHTFSEYITK